MKLLPILFFLSVGLISSCGNKHDHSHSHSHEDGVHGHSHDSNNTTTKTPAKILDAFTVPATDDSPEYLQLATNIEIIEDINVAASSKSSVFTHEGYFGSLLFGEDMRAFSIKLEAGMYLEEHPHPTESMVYTVSGKWVLCSEKKRKVMEAGSVFHFGSDMPTGWEAPFEGGALLFICKKKNPDVNYASYTKGIRDMQSGLDKEYQDGREFYYHQLEEDHPAIKFAKEHNPNFEEVLQKSKL